MFHWNTDKYLSFSMKTSFFDNIFCHVSCFINLLLKMFLTFFSHIRSIWFKNKKKGCQFDASLSFSVLLNILKYVCHFCHAFYREQRHYCDHSINVPCKYLVFHRCILKNFICHRISRWFSITYAGIRYF